MNGARIRRIRKAKEKSGLSYASLLVDMYDAHRAVGISLKDYVNFSYFDVDKENREEEYERIKIIKEKRKVERQQCIELAMKEKGWTEAEAKEHLSETIKRTGMSAREYKRYYFFNIKAEEQVERYQEIVGSKQARKDRSHSNTAKYYKVISKKTGKKREEIKADVLRANELAGATFKDYYAFRMWEIDDEERKTYFTQRVSNALSRKYDTNLIHRDILLNKELSCAYFKDFLKRPWCINRDISLKEFQEIFRDEKKIVYKPLDGNGGLGVKVINIEGGLTEEIYNEVMSYSRGVVEGFVAQHAKMKKLASNSVNTVRIVTIASEDEVITPEIVYAAIRMGSGSSVVDNFSEGGFVAGVNLDTGIIETNAVNIDGIPHRTHPVTGTVIRGFEIPYFEEAKELVKNAASTISGYLGWDIAIAEDGPVLIEANIMPGNRILQMPYVEDRIGKRNVIERFL